MILLIDNVALDLPDDTEISIKATNPLFSENGWSDTYSYSVEFPKSSRNFLKLYSLFKSAISASFKLSHSGLLFIDGTIEDVRRNDRSFTVNVQDKGMAVRKELTEAMLPDLDLGFVTVCEQSDTPLEKLSKWYDHMVATTLTEPPEEGTHKFPKIWTQGYKDVEDPLQELNQIHQSNRSVVNAYAESDFLTNTGVPIANSLYTAKNWYMTVSPCVRIEHILNTLVDSYNFYLENSPILSIPEFKQAVHFSGYVLDKLEVSAGNTYNVHGIEFDLADFLPEANVLSFFEMLQEQFGAFFILRGNRLRIDLKKDAIASKPINLSKYASSSFIETNEKAENYAFKYDIAQSDDQRLYRYLLASFVAPSQFLYPQASFTIDFYTAARKQITFTHIPLASVYGVLSGVFDNYTDFLTGDELQTRGFNEYSAFLRYPEVIKSDEFPEEETEKSEVFRLGFLRGIFPTRRDDLDEENNVIGHTPVEHLWSYNFNSPIVAEDSIAEFEDYAITFGNSSAYASEQEDAFSIYHLPYLQFMAKRTEVQKVLNLPIYKINEILSWKNPKHLIEQRNLSFEGIVKEVNFTLSLRTISKASITYYVASKPKKGSFNDDFSNDFEYAVK